MKTPLTWSVAFHAVIVAIAILGLPYLKPALPPIVDTSITVEIVDSSDVMESKIKPVEKPVRREQPEQKKEEPPKPVMPQVTATKPPKPTQPAPPQADEFRVPEEKAPEPVKKPQPEKTKTPPKPLKRPVLTQPAEEEQEEFKSLLRNLMPTEEEPMPSDTPRNGEQTAPQPVSAPMSQGELDSLKRQLSGCWRVMAGARYAENLVVELKLFVNPDRTVRDVRIVDQLSYNTNSFYRAAADSAVSAVYRCKTLDLPPNKYDLWQVINVKFDPRTML